jgi:hypothetical protein
MKLAIVVLGMLFSLLIQNTVYSQGSTVPTEEEKKKQTQIDGYIHIIKNSPNPKEVEKAKAYLLELGIKYEETVPVQLKKMTDAEEQKKMSETLTPEQYNAWKAEKHKNSVIQPIEIKSDTIKK